MNGIQGHDPEHSAAVVATPPSVPAFGVSAVPGRLHMNPLPRGENGKSLFSPQASLRQGASFKCHFRTQGKDPLLSPSWFGWAQAMALAPPALTFP